MLHTVAQLAENRIGDICRTLTDEVDTYPFAADKLHHLHHFLQKGLWRIVKQQMCFVKEKHHGGFFGISDFWQNIKKFCHHPKQKCTVEQRRINQFCGIQQVDISSPLFIPAHPVFDLQRRLSKELISAHILQF